VAREPYALTLWTYLQSEEAERLDSLTREREQIRGADMIATAFHDPKKLQRYDANWRSRVMGKPDELTQEELSARADDLWALHESRRKRPVS
jgi:hypothetical protein